MIVGLHDIASDSLLNVHLFMQYVQSGMAPPVQRTDGGQHRENFASCFMLLVSKSIHKHP